MEYKLNAKDGGPFLSSLFGYITYFPPSVSQAARAVSKTSLTFSAFPTTPSVSPEGTDRNKRGGEDTEPLAPHKRDLVMGF